MNSDPIAIRCDMLTYTITADGAMSVSADVPFWTSAQALYDYCKANHVRAVFMLDGHDLDASWWTMAEPGRCHATRPQGAKFDTVGRLQPHYLSERAVWAYNVKHDSRWSVLMAAWTEGGALGLWAAVTAYERAMLRTVSYSPGSMALSLLTPSKLKNHAWYDASGPRLPRVRGGDAHHIAPAPLTHETGWNWLHVYDVNAAHLAAAQSVDLGCGALELSDENSRKDAPRYCERPGIYYCSVVDKRAAPPYLRHDGWYDRALAKHAGPAVSISRAYTYPAKHQALRDWVARLWTAREKTSGHALKLVKAGYTQALGRMGHKSQAGYNDKENRPLWYGAIVAEAGRRQWQRWQLTEQQAAVRPLFLWSDTIGVLTRNPINARTSDQLGGLRHEGSHDLRQHPELLALLQQGKLIKSLRYLGTEADEEGAEDGD